MSEPMSHNEMRSHIGRTGMKSFESFKFRVKVLDARSSGRSILEYLITPIEGTGQTWVSSTSVELDAQEGESK